MTQTMAPHFNALLIETFIQRAIDKHGCVYDYSKVIYTNIDTKIKIVCKLHGVFETTPYRHTKGVGCSACKGPKYRELLKHNKKIKLGKEEFIKRAKGKHGDKYDYSKVVYKNNLTKVEIICPAHGVFWQIPTNHMRGVGCPGCKFDKTTPMLLSSTKERAKKCANSFIERAKKTHKGKGYDYSKTNYSSWEKRVTVICPDHGAFRVCAHNHLAGSGCPSCSDKAFRWQKPAIFYYLKIKTNNDTPIYKIGITNKSVNERYVLRKDREKIKVLFTKDFALGAEAWKYEKGLKNKFKEYLYVGEPPLSRVGISEMFIKDILSLDNKKRAL